jgi:hypothetical protein
MQYTVLYTKKCKLVKNEHALYTFMRSIGIWTYDLKSPANEDDLYLRPCGHLDGLVIKLGRLKLWDNVMNIIRTRFKTLLLPFIF